MSSGIILEGFDELLIATEELGRKGSKIENDALRVAADYIAEKGKVNAPIKSGKLKESIQRGNIKTKKMSKKIEIGSNLYYFRFIEEGTSNIVPNPFLSRAFEQNKYAAYKIIERQLKLGLGL